MYWWPNRFTCSASSSGLRWTVDTWGCLNKFGLTGTVLGISRACSHCNSGSVCSPVVWALSEAHVFQLIDNAFTASSLGMEKQYWPRIGPCYHKHLGEAYPIQINCLKNNGWRDKFYWEGESNLEKLSAIIFTHHEMRCFYRYSFLSTIIGTVWLTWPGSPYPRDEHKPLLWSFLKVH